MWKVTGLLILLAISGGKVYAQADGVYYSGLERWHEERMKSLKAENGWLNVAGLFWLKEGKNSFGTDKQNAVVFPEGTIAANAGSFERNGNTVKLLVGNATIAVNGKPVSEAIIFHPDSLHNPIVSSGNLRWTIIKRDDKIGVRLRNLASKKVTDFKGVERFKADTAWRLTATFQKHPLPTQIPITNVLGQTSQQSSPGKLFFAINNQVFSLDALEEGDELFMLFADETSGDQTYGTGRFLNVEKAGADGKTIIDFNKAYNPPCAFTEFATCPLPPKQNVLPVAITAGEKNYMAH